MMFPPAARAKLAASLAELVAVRQQALSKWTYDAMTPSQRAAMTAEAAMAGRPVEEYTAAKLARYIELVNVQIENLEAMLRVDR